MNRVNPSDNSVNRPDEAPVTVSADDLRTGGAEAAFEAVEVAVEDYREEGASGNVAVVAPPYAGRAALLDHAEALLDDVERVRLGPAASEGRAPSVPDADAVLVDDCQYLYRRRIGGFRVLDRLLERMATADTLYVTSWNSYAWRYLEAVKDVGASFPVQVEVPPLDGDGVAAMIRARWERAPEFVQTGEDGRIKTLDVVRRPVRLPGGRSVGVPVPKPNPEWVSSWWTTDDEESIEAVVFEKVARQSRGNPGVAATAFERALDGDEIAPAHVVEPTVDGRLDDADAVLLLAVVSKGSVTREALEDVARGPVDTSLATLADEGLVELHGESVSVAPNGLQPAVAELERRRLLW